jgi:hypothetical protein
VRLLTAAPATAATPTRPQATLRSTGMRHAQGGWPDNVDGTEHEQVDRYIKKATKDARFKAAVAGLAATAEAAVRQNGTVDIFEAYFEPSTAAAAAAAAATAVAAGVAGGGKGGGGGAAAAPGGGAATAGASAAKGGGAAPAAGAPGGAAATSTGGGTAPPSAGAQPGGGGGGGGTHGASSAPGAARAGAVLDSDADAAVLAASFTSPALRVEPPFLRSVGALHDPAPVKRTATALSWHPEGGRLAVAYSVLRFQDDRVVSGLMPPQSYVWDVTSPTAPVAELLPPSPLTALRFNPKTPDVLVGGCYNGLVTLYDVKQKPRGGAVATSALERSHRDPVYDVAWVQSKTNTQLASCSTGACGRHRRRRRRAGRPQGRTLVARDAPQSRHFCCSQALPLPNRPPPPARTDGQLLWWDARKLSEPTDSLQLSVNGGGVGGFGTGSLFGASALEYNVEAGEYHF